jgi:hypothetical protein
MKCALYRHFDADGSLLYIGVTSDPTKRTAAHKKNSPWFAEVARTEIEWQPSRADALLAETISIGKESPRNNIHSAGKTRGAAEFIDRVGKEYLASRLGVTFTAVRNAHWRDRMPAYWALIVATICVEQGVRCPSHAFGWNGSNGIDHRCISERMFSAEERGIA